MNLDKLPKKPNMVLIITDQEREVMHWPDGWAEENLPARSRLMAHGLTFRNAHCNTAACSPSRASLFTGLYPAQHGVKNLIFCDDPKDEAKRRTPQLPSSLPNIATVLAEAGYHVVLKGKYHLSRPVAYNDEMKRHYWSDADTPHMAEQYGFQEWNPPDMSDPMGLSDFGGGDINNDGRYVDGSGTAAGHYMPADEQYRQSAINFINTYDGDKPFCLIVSLVNPHDVQAYPGRGLQGIMEMKIKPIYEQGGYDLDDFKDLPIGVPPTVDEDLSTKPTVHRSFRQLIGVGTGHVRTRTRQQNYARFYAYLCREVDQQIGKVLDALDSNGLTEQTLIIRTSDHGEMAMSHGGLRQKFYNAYRETLNVPLIFSNPKLFPTPETTDAFAGLVDILPTLAAIADVPDRERYQFRGQDLTPILVDSSVSVQDTIHFTYEDDVFPVKGANCIRALVEKDWKYAVYYDPFKGAPTEYEMYDLKNDPLETTNLAHPTHFKPDYADQRTRLHNRLIEVMLEHGTLPDETKWPTADEFEPARKGENALTETTPTNEQHGARQYEAQIDIDAPIETVWQLFTDFASFGQWNPLLTSVEVVNQGEIGVGTELNVSVSALPAPVRATVIEYDPPFTLRWRDHVPLNLMTPRFGVTLEPLEGERTRFTVAESFDGPLIWLLGRMLDRQMPPLYMTMCEALKERITPSLSLNQNSSTIESGNLSSLMKRLIRAGITLPPLIYAKERITPSPNSDKNPSTIQKGNTYTMKTPLILAGLTLPPLMYAGVPKLLTLLGLHPHYHGRKFNLAGKKALVICTSHDTLGDTGQATGVYGSEMTVPYYQFLDAGMQVDVASPKGGDVPIEPASLKWPLITAADKRFRGDADFQRKIKHSLKFDEVNFTEYDLIFMAGGWGAAFDLGYSEVLGEKASQAYRNGAILGSVCHGALGLLNVKDENGKPLLAGLNATAVTDKQVQELGINLTPQHPETELRKAGAKFQSNTAFRDMLADLTVVDGRVVTGQNQNAGAETAQKMMMLLEKQARN